MDYNSIKVENQDGVIWLTLNRPDKLNAINEELMREMTDFFEGQRHDNNSRIIIIRGEGRAFCAGADLSGWGNANEPRDFGRLHGYFTGQKQIGYVIDLIRQIPQPLIAAVHGYATGGGMGLALACDMRIIAESARFQVSYIRRGLSACDGGSSYFLPRLIGSSRAFEYMYTGRFIDAQTAEKIGLVSRVVPDDQLKDAAMELAQEVVRNSPIGLRLTKEALNMNIDAPSLPAALHLENRNQILASSTEDMREAVLAFFEKREPVFHNR